MECINCGGTINSIVAGQVVKCVYCGTSCAWLPTVKAKSTEQTPLSSEMEKLLMVAQMDIDAKRYQTASKTLNRAIELDPTCWQAYANLAISTFWLGCADYSHLNEVTALIGKAAQLSDEADFISGVSRAVSYNIAQLVNIKNPAGDLLFHSVNALKVSKFLVPDFHERDEIIDQFISRQVELISKRFLAQLNRNKKEVDPPKSELLLLGKMLQLATIPLVDHHKYFIAFASYNTKKQDAEIIKLLEHSIEFYLKTAGTQSVPVINFPFFGSPQVN